ncbi:roadblock/LC7 domain-containing protein [Streptomyces uncialis]|uniref:roadblock/LC7 domain-containing protein n=1 Tax=Streptomyces uncialis TaxID=1048205 RepID=UPI0037FE448C
MSREARNLHWLLTNLVEEVPGLLSVAVVSSDGLLLLSSDPGRTGADASGEAGRPAGPKGSSADLATIVSGLGSLTLGAAKLMDGGGVKQTMVAMADGSLFVMSISDGSLLGVHATPDCDMSVIAYHMALFVGRAGHVLTPELRSELRQSLESRGAADPSAPGEYAEVPRPREPRTPLRTPGSVQ